MRRQQYRENGRFGCEPELRTWKPGDEEREEEADAQQEAAQRGDQTQWRDHKRRQRRDQHAKGKAKAKAVAQPPVDPTSRRRALSTEDGSPRNQIVRRRAKSADNVRAAPSQFNPEAEAQPRQGT
ncbi:MAG: hypothetical protein ACKPKO_46250, partial [Candidatus Fonsibacter sp.]